MAMERLPMRKIREILRMRWELGLSVREVAQNPGVSVGVISKAVQRAKNAELDWVAAGALSEAEIEVRRSCLPALRGGLMNDVQGRPPCEIWSVGPVGTP
jgi:transposase